MDIEYQRYLRVGEITHRFLGLAARPRDKYEIRNIVERWLVTLANNYNGVGDVILHPSDCANDKMIGELLEKSVIRPGQVANIKRDLLIYEDFTPNTTIVSAIPTLDGNVLRYKRFSAEIPPRRLALFQGKTLETIVRMVIRYYCLNPGGQQWMIPLDVYGRLYRYHGVNVEAYSSPLNCQLQLVEPSTRFCSLFLDTDITFGSLGNFTRLRGNPDMRIVANPPFIESVMLDAVLTIERLMGEGVSVIYLIMPAWTDMYAYVKADGLSQWKRTYMKRTYHYEDMEGKRIPASFNTVVFGFGDAQPFEWRS